MGGALRIHGGIESVESKTSRGISEGGERRLCCEMKLDSSVEQGGSWRGVRGGGRSSILLNEGIWIGD